MKNTDNIAQAELKIRKLRELSARNGGDNPEPSPEIWEGAETRHGLCMKCDGQIPSDKRSNAKFCSAECRNAYNAYQYCLRKNKFKKPGVGSGGNQLGENNHQYKTGIGTYSSKAIKYYGAVCNRCSTEQNILVHHIDEDRTNNSLSNLEVLCKQCHQNHHCIRDEQGKFMKHI